MVSPWVERGDLRTFLGARFEYLALSLDNRRLHAGHDVFSRFVEYDAICGIVSGLAYLHAHNVVHGDLSAATILLNEAGNPVVCDYGMSQVLDSDDAVVVTGERSLRWMSPDLLEDSPKTTASDVYALGMTISEILTGKVPFVTLSSDVEIIRAIFAGQRPEPDPMSREGQDFEVLWSVASLCWDADPEKRPSAQKVLELIGGDEGCVAIESS